MSLIDCSKVIVKDAGIKGFGAFANQNIKKGELIEYGIVRRVECNGNKNPYVFTWSDDRTIWAYPSGCLTFYNASKNPNCIVNRFFNEDRFEVYALNDINKGEELLHKYKSLEWREAFEDLRNIKNL